MEDKTFNSDKEKDNENQHYLNPNELNNISEEDENMNVFQKQKKKKTKSSSTKSVVGSTITCTPTVSTTTSTSTVVNAMNTPVTSTKTLDDDDDDDDDIVASIDTTTTTISTSTSTTTTRSKNECKSIEDPRSLNKASKRWGFTINVPKEEDIFWITGQGYNVFPDYLQYLIVQEEIGERRGLVHFQGFLYLKHKHHMSWLSKNVCSNCYWYIPGISDELACKYCRKDRTYTGRYRFEMGILPTTTTTTNNTKSGGVKRTRTNNYEEAEKVLDQIKLSGKEGSCAKDYVPTSSIKSKLLMLPGFLSAHHSLTCDKLGPYRPDFKVITMVGGPSSGKSYAIYKLFPCAGKTTLGNCGTWFNNNDSDVLVIENFSNQIPPATMRNILDNYPLNLEVKGGMKPAMYNTVIITSNLTPDLWFGGIPEKSRSSSSSSSSSSKLSASYIDKIECLKGIWDRIGFSYGDFKPYRKNAFYLQPPSNFDIKQCQQFFMENLKRIMGKTDDDDETSSTTTTTTTTIPDKEKDQVEISDDSSSSSCMDSSLTNEHQMNEFEPPQKKSRHHHHHHHDQTSSVIPSTTCSSSSSSSSCSSRFFYMSPDYEDIDPDDKEISSSSSSCYFSNESNKDHPDTKSLQPVQTFDEDDMNDTKSVETSQHKKHHHHHHHHDEK